jgi:hypothetical protein
MNGRTATARRRQKLKTEMLRTEILGVWASWREKFIGQLRVADVSRKAAKSQRLFLPGAFAPWRLLPRKLSGLAVGFFKRTADWVRLRQDEEGWAVLRPPPFLLSAFCCPNFGFTEPRVRAILSYFEIFRVNSSSAFTIQHSKFTIISTPDPPSNKG